MEQERYELLLQGGHVIDPANGIDGVRDVALAGGVVQRVEKNINPTLAATVIPLEGAIVTPGLIDMHCHIYPQYPYPANGLACVDPQAHMFQSGVTTAVDAGTCGWRDFYHFKETVIDRARLRILAFVNIAAGGMVDFDSEQRLDDFQPALVAEVAKAYPDVVVGTKTAHYWVGKPCNAAHPAWESVERTVHAAALCGKRAMIDFRPNLPWRTYKELLLEKMRPGDIHTHVFAHHFHAINPQGKLEDFMWQAKARGILFDLGHGSGSFLFRNAVPAFRQGFVPDTLGSDLYLDNVNGPVISLLNILSKYLAIGMPLQQAVALATVKPAEILGHPELGTLTPGAEADVAVLRRVKGPYGFADAGGTRLAATERLECLLTLRGGEPVYNPNGLGLPSWE